MTRAESGTRFWRIAVLVLVVVDVVLVSVVLGIGSRSSTAVPGAVTLLTQSPSTTPLGKTTSTPTTSPSSSPEPSMASPTASPEPSTSATPTPDASAAAAAAAPVARRLVAVDARRAWRVSPGTRDGGGASVSVTSDGGQTWAARSSPLAMVSRLVIRPGSAVVFAVGADGSCSPELRRTVDRGATWRMMDGTAGFFATDPTNPGSVVVPGRGIVQACGGQPIIDLAVGGHELQVLCPGGRLRTIGDGDAMWTDGPQIAGAIALTTSPIGSRRTYVARAGPSACDGVQIVDAGRLRDPIACIPHSGQVTPGTVSLSIVGARGWLLVADDVYTSGDNLDNWSKR